MFISLCLFVWMLAAAGCSDKDKSGAAAEGAGLLRGVRVSQIDANISNWTLDSKAARLEESETRIYFEEPRIKFFEKNEVSSELKADTGFLDLLKKDAELARNVLVVSKAEQLTLETARLFFSSEKNKIWTDEEVTILRGRNVIRGLGFTANPDLSEIEITRQETKVNQPSDIPAEHFGPPNGRRASGSAGKFGGKSRKFRQKASGKK
ncbi:MAG: LPS export ABC transporter periplasmic protein LptC [Elusimicrobia bacterium]|nr:LPS export ABC transporter periplasmic protein LptC [Elusimicrobiota bacterium]